MHVGSRLFYEINMHKYVVTSGAAAGYNSSWDELENNWQKLGSIGLCGIYSTGAARNKISHSLDNCNEDIVNFT